MRHKFFLAWMTFFGQKCPSMSHKCSWMFLRFALRMVINSQPMRHEFLLVWMTELPWRVMNGRVWDGLTKRRWCGHGGCRCLCLWWVWGQKEGEVWWNAPWRFPLEWAWSLVELWKQLLLPVRLHFHMLLFGLCRWGGTPYLYRVLIFRVQDRVALWVFPLEGPSRRVGCQRSIVWLRWHWGWFDCCLRLCWLWCCTCWI